MVDDLKDNQRDSQVEWKKLEMACGIVKEVESLRFFLNLQVQVAANV